MRKITVAYLGTSFKVDDFVAEVTGSLNVGVPLGILKVDAVIFIEEVCAESEHVPGWVSCADLTEAAASAVVDVELRARNPHTGDPFDGPVPVKFRGEKQPTAWFTVTWTE